MKVKQKYFVGDELGVHKIIEELDVREVKGRKYKMFDKYYLIQCKLCGHVREAGQKSMSNGNSGPSYYCLNCPPNIQREGKKRKKKDYEIKRKYEGVLDNNEAKLFRLAIYGRLA